MNIRSTQKLLIIPLLLILSSCEQVEQIHFVDGTQQPVTELSDKWMVINYWAEWCGPCREEIPELNELHHDSANHGLVVFGVNWDGFTGEKLDGMIERMNVEFPTLRDDPYQQYGYERAQQLPVTVLINPERQVSEILYGPQTVASILANIE